MILTYEGVGEDVSVSPGSALALRKMLVSAADKLRRNLAGDKHERASWEMDSVGFRGVVVKQRTSLIASEADNVINNWSLAA